MAYSVIKPRGDIKAAWESTNPILRLREFGVEWETAIGVGEAKIKIGDGIKHWNDLDYAIVNNVTKKIVTSFATVTAENPELEAGSTMDLLWAATKKKFAYLNNQVNGIKTMIGAFNNITIESGGVNNAVSNITSAIQLLNSGKLSTADIYNGLDSTNASLALAASQGRALKNSIDALNSDYNTLNREIKSQNYFGDSPTNHEITLPHTVTVERALFVCRLSISSDINSFSIVKINGLARFTNQGNNADHRAVTHITASFEVFRNDTLDSVQGNGGTVAIPSLWY